MTRPAAAPLRSVGQRGAEVLALSTLAVAQPLLDLFGANPEFFVASGAGSGDIVAFALVVVLALPLGLLGVEQVVHAVAGERAASRVHLGVLGLLAFLLGLAVARQLGWDTTVAAALLGAAAAVLVPLARHRFSMVGLGLRYLALLPVLVLGQFLWLSPTGELIGQEDARAVEGLDVGVDAPVVMVMFDELPLASLLGPDGRLAATRYPNFARLAAGATWYRDTVAVAAGTVRSVPSALTGQVPDDTTTAPVSAEWPRNLFTLLGDGYELDVHEYLTDLCPAELCPPEADGGSFSRLGRALTDAGVVYGHQVLPADLRRDLPAIDQSWDGFVDQDVATVEPSERLREAFEEGGQESFVAALREADPEAFGRRKGEPLLRAVEEADLGRGRLLFAHDSFPHFPWERTPEGGVYEGEGGLAGVVDGRWGEDPALVREGLARHLLQVGYADTVLGVLIDRLEDEGLWDDALVVVTADHGIAFRPGSPTRQPTRETLHEVFRVPLFVKAPGQTEGRLDDRVASLPDILPTIVDLLEVDVDWAFDGHSLAGAPVAVDRQEQRRPGTFAVPGGFEEAARVARRNGLLLPYLDTWSGLARVGPHADLVGGDVDRLAGDGASAVDVGAAVSVRWRLEEGEVLADFDPGADPLPVLVHGRVEAPLPAGIGPEVLVALDGRLVGAARLAADGGFRSLIDHRVVRPGDNEVVLYAVVDGRGGRTLRPLGSPTRG